jgi:carbon storage regulator
MLVLTRKKNESIVINDVIKVTVVEIRGDKVRLGIEAPREIDVHRQEVYDQIHGNKHVDVRHEATTAPMPPSESGTSS